MRRTLFVQHLAVKHQLFFVVVNRNANEELAKFLSLGYQDKVRLFDEMFRLVPFDFSKMDLACSWFVNEVAYNQLVEFLNLENRNKNIYTRTIRHKNKDTVFDVRPLSKTHRVFFNQFVVSKFLATKDEISKQLSLECKRSSNPLSFLEERKKHLLSVVDWARHTLLEQKTCLRHQFLHIFLNGFRAYQNVNDELIKVRRKFVELYLYSQGLLLAEHIDELNKKIQAHESRKSKTPMNPSQKILLLHELGVIELLQKKFREKNINLPKESLAELICLICFDEPAKSKLIADQISALTNVADSDVHTKQSIHLVRSELSRFGL